MNQACFLATKRELQKHTYPNVQASTPGQSGWSRHSVSFKSLSPSFLRIISVAASSPNLAIISDFRNHFLFAHPFVAFWLGGLNVELRFFPVTRGRQPGLKKDWVKVRTLDDLKAIHDQLQESVQDMVEHVRYRFFQRPSLGYPVICLKTHCNFKSKAIQWWWLGCETHHNLQIIIYYLSLSMLMSNGSLGCEMFHSLFIISKMLS